MSKMIVRTSAFAVVVAGLFAATQAYAIPLFSVNTASDQLVRIDSTTGAVTTVGSLGQNALDIDLALTADGRLWGLNSGGGRVDIWEIDKNTGALISSYQVFDGATPVMFAEGLAARGNQLKLGYDLTNTANSKTLGNLASNGVVTGGILTTVDMDGLADGNANPFGLYAFDREPGTATTLYGINPAGGAATLIQTYSDTLGFHDLVTLARAEGIAIETFTGKLYSLDLTTGAVLGITNIGPTPSGVFNGLALADPLPSTVPESGSLLVFGLGLASLGVWRKIFGRAN